MSSKRAYFWLTLAATVFFFGDVFLSWGGTTEAGTRNFILHFTIYVAVIIVTWSHALFWGAAPTTR